MQIIGRTGRTDQNLLISEPSNVKMALYSLLFGQSSASQPWKMLSLCREQVHTK